VLGSYYLFTHTLQWDLLLPATACGLLATAVLNINNVRDIETDAASGKITLAVRLGRNRAIAYHWVLLGAALLATIAFLLTQPASLWPWIFLPAMKPLTDAACTLREFRWRGADRRPQEDRHQRISVQPAALCRAGAHLRPTRLAMKGLPNEPFLGDVSMRCCFIRPM
jgi:1,4-dihydroxy-2-naphthoate octaprenyltransferase